MSEEGSVELRWPKTVKEFFVGTGYGDPKGNPRTCREAVCGTATQVLLCQLWFSFIFDCISVFLLLKSPTSTDDVYIPTYYDIVYFVLQILLLAWTIAVVLKKYYVQVYVVFFLWILVALCDTYSLILPIVKRRFVKHGDFVSYTVNESMDIMNDIFILMLLFAYLLQERENRDKERQALLPKTIDYTKDEKETTNSIFFKLEKEEETVGEPNVSGGQTIVTIN